MSACKQRHEKRKAERTRRRRLPAVTQGAAALAAAAVIAAGTSAYADPIRYDNPPGPGHFEWNASAGQQHLDVTADCGSQPGASGTPGTFTFEVGAAGYGNDILGSPGGEVQRVDNIYNTLLPGLDAGVLIPTTYGGIYFGFSSYVTNSDPYNYYGQYTLLPEGEATYLGLRFDAGGGNQYGWIGVVRTATELDAFAWGYETEPGVPIPAGIPEPGTLALLAFGAMALGRRRA